MDGFFFYKIVDGMFVLVYDGLWVVEMIGFNWVLLKYFYGCLWGVEMCGLIFMFDGMLLFVVV